MGMEFKKGETMPLINWKQDRIKGVPIRSGKIKKGAVQSKKNVIFLPGWNEIDEKTWKVIEGNCQLRLKDGQLEVLKLTVDGKEQLITFTQLRKENSEKAVEVIQNTFSVETLKKWKKSTEDAEIRLAIVNQIEKIENYEGDVKKRKVGFHK